MRQVIWGLALLALSSTSLSGAEGIDIRSKTFSASIRAGSVVGLTASDGTQYVCPPVEHRGLSIHRGDTGPWATSSEPAAILADGQSLTQTYATFSEPDTARAEVQYEVNAATGDLVIRQKVDASQPGVWGVGWSIADIPLDYAILVPGGSGLRLTRDTPGPTFQYDYPLTWEVQFVIVEGPRGGFWAWAEDPQGRFKRLVVERRSTGWRLGLITINDAPFDKLTTCESVTWRLNTYEGDWRVPAQRYRAWFQQTCHPAPLVEQQPPWVKDIRGCVIMGLDTNVLETLPTRFDPHQTLLYLYDWREPGYDRNYPDYTQMRPGLMPFMQRARELGFRAMLHVNYFGVDPLNPAYKQFEPFQVRSPWGQHDKEWWVWPPEDPDIRFAYINPACQAWRDFFTAAMVQLCQNTGADALHLDQTLCIYNDHNGRIDGMSMLEGNIALHRQLRQALPHVALSGEGLNEVTCRYEAFAQRHVWGLDHTKGTYDRRFLDAAHPISSYILRPFTTMYGYLGCAPPEDDQLYAAWNEAYRHWGVIPTLKPTRANLAAGGGFAEQFFDELRGWQEQRVDIDLDGPWPSEIAFPFRTADGQPFVATRDRRWICGDRVISQTVTGTTQLKGAGTIPGWLAYDANRLLGLHADRWYPVFPRPHAADRFHVREMPESAVIDFVAVSSKLALVKLQDAQPVVADLTTLLEQAVCGTRPAQGSAQQRVGPGEFPDGASFTNSADVIASHPPWKTTAGGEAFARFTCVLPENGATRFVSDVYLDPGAVGPDKSDGVTFFIRASDGAHQISRQFHHAAAQPLLVELDLSEFQGQTMELELAVDPGPRNSPTYDWARWLRPRIERRMRDPQTIVVETLDSWPLVLNEDGNAPLTQTGTLLSVETAVPGAVAFLREQPTAVTLPADLSRTPDQVFFVLDSGNVVDSAIYAGVTPGVNSVGGLRRNGLFAHPPNNGRTMATYLFTLPADSARFVTHVGLRDGSKSEGVEVSVEINGSPCARRMIRPGGWEMLDVDLARWASQPIVLSLITDSAGSFNYDWTAWGEPGIVAN
jgi:hypothetical protein